MEAHKPKPECLSLRGLISAVENSTVMELSGWSGESCSIYTPVRQWNRNNGSLAPIKKVSRSRVLESGHGLKVRCMPLFATIILNWTY